jgi:hypothetical protein
MLASEKRSSLIFRSVIDEAKEGWKTDACIVFSFGGWANGVTLTNGSPSISCQRHHTFFLRHLRFRQSKLECLKSKSNKVRHDAPLSWQAQVLNTYYKN